MVLLQVSTQPSAPFNAARPRGYADVGQYNPDFDQYLPQAMSVGFSRLPRRPPKSNKALWRVAKTTIRSSYMPPVYGDLGPGSYDPLVLPRGIAADLAVKASQTGGHSPRKRAASAAAPRHRCDIDHWPNIVTERRPSTPVTELYRKVTLGDGTSMMMPAPPGMVPMKPVFHGREPTLMKLLPGLDAMRMHADLTSRMAQLERPVTWNAAVGPPARLPARSQVVPPPPSASQSWALTALAESRRVPGGGVVR